MVCVSFFTMLDPFDYGLARRSAYCPRVGQHQETLNQTRLMYTFVSERQ
jgi:hypothetical protein